jgi:hypothetical protein
MSKHRHVTARSSLQDPHRLVRIHMSQEFLVKDIIALRNLVRG